MRGLVTAVLFALCALAYCEEQGDEAKLINYLTAHSQKYARPVTNQSDVTTVKFDFALYEADIEDWSRRSVVVNLRGVARYLWFNVNLKWDPKKYGGVSTVRLPDYEVWKPDIKLYNSHTKPTIESSNVVVYSSGDVIWNSKTYLQVVCDRVKVNGTRLESFECLPKFGSWSYDGNQIDLYEGKAEIDLSDFKSRELKIVKNVGKKHTKYYPCCSEPYLDIRFNLTLAEI
eukprot:GHVU01161177.1.p1 GENE.GHVU01161177.1~~GHVU01161177.1.p1  ORF type:complete len:230 (-),score=15.06 GHVU01161177.1:160-849(-)